MVLELIFFIIGLILFFSYIILKIKLSYDKKKYGILEGEIVYTDLDKPAKAILSKNYRLIGKPDYIIKRKNNYIPIEVKKVESNSPFRNHILQLASYCLLLEDKFKKKIPFGVLVYDKGQQFKVPFDENLRKKLGKVISDIRNSIHKKSVIRNHNFVNRCLSCSYRHVCNQKISQ